MGSRSRFAIGTGGAGQAFDTCTHAGGKRRIKLTVIVITNYLRFGASENTLYSPTSGRPPIFLYFKSFVIKKVIDMHSVQVNF